MSVNFPRDRRIPELRFFQRSASLGPKVDSFRKNRGQDSAPHNLNLVAPQILIRFSRQNLSGAEDQNIDTIATIATFLPQFCHNVATMLPQFCRNSNTTRSSSGVRVRMQSFSDVKDPQSGGFKKNPSLAGKVLADMLRITQQTEE